LDGPIGTPVFATPTLEETTTPTKQSVWAIASPSRPPFEIPFREVGRLAGVGIGPSLQVGLSDYTASRNRRDGFSIVTTVFGGTLFVKETLAPITEFAPTIVVPPRTVAFA
jgi:hypothetical protein